ncbi:horcolin-like [Miscanthus floridulus]|uniref:horcolin-like n=1 Tax=Miscanthus floridulus TaxID=154761 RepID=UPI00345B17DE
MLLLLVSIPATAKPLKIGLFGDGGGSPTKYINDKQPPKTLEMIEIWSSSDVAGSGAVINGIRFTYIDDKGTQRIVPSKNGTWGSANGTLHKVTINTDKQEYVTKIEGGIGKAFDEDLGITSLKFTTKKSNNRQTYGPYGDPNNGTPFSVPLENAAIVGFFASFDTHLNGLGFYALQLASGNNA